MRILLVEDNDAISGPVASDLCRQHHVVEVADDGYAGFEYASSGVYDVIVLDIMLPGLDGLEICRRLRASKIDSMILMLTAKDSIHHKVAALDAGADDYVPKPFDLAELSARIRALGRRGAQERNPIMEYGGLRLDPQSRSCAFQGRPLNLTPTEFMIVATLMRNPTQVFSRAMLLDKVAPFERETGDTAIKTHITNIRRKARAAGVKRDLVVSVYGAGYRLAAAQ
jgi:DNA-binding response OmpR family regulator